MDDTANSIFGDIHNSTIIQMRDGSYPGHRQRIHDEPWQRMVAWAAVWEHTNPGRDATQDAVEAAGPPVPSLVKQVESAFDTVGHGRMRGADPPAHHPALTACTATATVRSVAIGSSPRG